MAHKAAALAFEGSLALIAPGFRLYETVGCSHNSVFCNYFIAKGAFWSQWLACCERIFHSAERGDTPVVVNRDASGIVRAFGSDLRRFLGRALSNRFLAFVAGLSVTTLLQSSTATGLMTTSFVTDGSVNLVPALAIMLGANVGTTLIVQVLSFNVAAVAPVLFLIGVTAFKRGGQTRTRDLGRVAIGVGLMVLSLHLLLDTLAPAENAPAVRTVLGAITAEPRPWPCEAGSVPRTARYQCGGAAGW